MFKRKIFLNVIVIIFISVFFACGEKSGGDKKVSSSRSRSSSGAENGSRIKIATFNLKFFGDNDRINNEDFGKFGKNLREPDDKLMKKITDLIKDVDILAVQEVENEKAISRLVDYMNKRFKNSKYKFYIYAKKSSCQNVGLIWNTKRLNGWRGYKFEKSFNVVDKTEERDIRFSRTPIYNHFEISGVKFTVVAVHLKAKGISEDGGKREKEAQKLADWIEYQNSKEGNEH
ncbi:MAG TPA: hypothetical protein PLQ81_09755, partial [bacterium]|nr:hypothetical protein [bacterium]